MKTSFKLKSGAEVVDDLYLVAQISNGKLIKIGEYLGQSVLPHFRAEVLFGNIGSLGNAGSEESEFL